MNKTEERPLSFTVAFSKKINNRTALLFPAEEYHCNLFYHQEEIPEPAVPFFALPIKLHLLSSVVLFLSS